MKKYVCSICAWEYDPAEGAPEEGVEPGTPFEDTPENFCCPVCGAARNHFFLTE